MIPASCRNHAAIVSPAACTDHERKGSHPVEFFQQIHRSIFDTSFYGELAAMSRRRKIFYLIQLLFLASLVAALSHCWYLLDAKRGIAAPLEAAFSDIAIKDGVLSSSRPLPYVVPPEEIAVLIDRAVNGPLIMVLDSSPGVVVDTAYQPKPGDPYPRWVLRSREMTLYLSLKSSYALSYATLAPGTREFQFSSQSINAFLRRNFLNLLFNYFMLELFACGFLTLLSICILSFAAFIFRIDRSGTWFHYASIAGFAVTPVPVGFMLMAVSGTSVPAGGFMLFLASALVIIRALRAMRTMTSTQNPGDGGHDF